MNARMRLPMCKCLLFCTVSEIWLIIGAIFAVSLTYSFGVNF